MRKYNMNYDSVLEYLKDMKRKTKDIKESQRYYFICVGYLKACVDAGIISKSEYDKLRKWMDE